MSTLEINTDAATLNKIIDYIKSLKVKFVIKEEESPYDPQFVKMVLERRENAKKGNTIRYTPELKHKWFGDVL